MVGFGMDDGLANAGWKGIVMAESTPRSVLAEWDDSMLLICEHWEMRRKSISEATAQKAEQQDFGLANLGSSAAICTYPHLVPTESTNVWMYNISTKMM